jgi:hypothetical protein
MACRAKQQPLENLPQLYRRLMMHRGASEQLSAHHLNGEYVR